MKRLVWLSLLAIAGAAMAVVAVVLTNRSPPPSTPPAAVASAPYASYVAGSGLTENARGNVAVATAVPGVVHEVYVRAGEAVHVGTPLFKVDDRDIRARRQVAEATLAQAQAAASKQSHHLDYLMRLQKLDPGAISADALTAARDDAAASAAAVGVARAEVQSLGVELDRRLVRSPVDARVLQVNVRAGEFAGDGTAIRPLLLLGDDTRMYLRVDVDENDAWRVRPTAKAVAFLRGDPRTAIPLRFEYVEPYVTPKTSLTGQATERTDVRVLQVVYSFERGTLPVYIGQQMDAFIEAAPAGSSSGPR